MSFPATLRAASAALLLIPAFPAFADEAAPDGATTPAADSSAPEVQESVPAPAAEAATPVPAAEPASAPWYRIRPQLELGFLAVLSHRIQFGKQGTYFDLGKDGGQDNLFFVWRASVEAELGRQHLVTFLYQPLDLNTSVQLKNDLQVDEARFAAGTPLQMRYGFPFYRLSYMYDLFEDDRRELAIGVSVQIRNATIAFEAGGGEQLKSYRDIGIVPLLKARGRYQFESGVFLGFEVDAIYAPISGLNGSDNEVVGSLVDGSLRAGVKLPYRSEVFLNVRYLGGGATGQSDPEEFSDGYTRNWLHFLTVSLGATVATF